MKKQQSPLKNTDDQTELILKLGEQYESKSENILLSLATKAIKGFFIFKRRKGDISAGCATFFAILSFCPVLLILISLLGMTIGDGAEAQSYVLNSLKGSFPHLAKWIVESIEKIVSNKIVGGAGSDVMNVILLIYSSLGMIASVTFGVNIMAKCEPKGGFVFEDGKALLSGVAMYAFMFSLVLVSQASLMERLFSDTPEIIQKTVMFLVHYNVLPAVLSLGFFTFFYKWVPSREVSLKDSFSGALAFVACFVMGKTFYWVYLHFARADIQANYGNFETLITAVMWVYYLMCAFLYGAAIAYMNKEEAAQASVIEEGPYHHEVPKIPSSFDNVA